MIETSFEQREYLSAKDVMVQMVRGILRYQFENRELTRFYRELSLDTTLIREVMTVYFSKERYYIEQMIRQGQMKQEFKRYLYNVYDAIKRHDEYAVLYPQYISEVLHSFPSETFS